MPPRTLLHVFRPLLRNPSTRPTTAHSTTITPPSCPSTFRSFYQTPTPRLKWGKYKTLQEAKSRYSTGPFSWTAGLLFLLTGGGLITYFRFEKERLERAAIQERNKGVGRPRVGGGGFELTDMNGRRVGDGELRGVLVGENGEGKVAGKGGKRFMLVYFGFTHCPDICPEELDKMAAMINLVEKQCGQNVLTPIFITCDPARDTPPVLKEYLAEFHPKIIGLTGTYDEIKNVCKSYRVYFSTPPVVQPGQDYLVDHSIYFYLMDPDGDFIEALGRQHSPEAAAKVISDHIKDWIREGRIKKD